MIYSFVYIIAAGSAGVHSIVSVTRPFLRYTNGTFHCFAHIGSGSLTQANINGFILDPCYIGLLRINVSLPDPCYILRITGSRYVHSLAILCRRTLFWGIVVNILRILAAVLQYSLLVDQYV